MAFTTQRYLINNLATADTITASSQGVGAIRQPKKTGTGSATMTPSGSYTGAANLLYTVQCDLAGSVDGAATIRWRTSATAVGSWEASSVAATSTAISLSNGVSISFSSGTLVLNDKWQFPVYAEYGPGKLFLNDRDAYWKSGALGDNLISNGDFESGFGSGLGTGWSKSGAAQTYADETSIVHGGAHAQKITVVDDGQGIGISQAESITSGNEYYVEFWVYGSTGLNVKSYNPNVSSGATDTTAISATTWTKISWYGTGTATGSNSFYFYVAAGDCTIGDYIILDDIRVFSLHYLDLDLTTAQEVTAAALLDHNLSSDGAVILKGNSSASWASPGYEDTSFDTSVDPIIEYDGDTYRYWRFVLQDVDNSDDFHSIGKLYLGTYSELTGSLKNIPWGSTKADSLNTTENRSEAGKVTEHVYTRQAIFETQYFPTRTSGDLTTLEAVWAATFNITTGQRVSILVHYFYDEDSTLYLCRCASKAFDLEYRDYGHYAVSLSWEQEVMTRSI